MGTENYYEILGIERDADDDAVKHAFRELAKHCHPDRNPNNSEAEHQFKLINTAYEALKDADRREAYREWLEFADKREQSKKTQWTRLAALVLLLGVGPAAVVYWVIWGLLSGDIVGPRGTPVAVLQTEQPVPGTPGASPLTTTIETKPAPSSAPSQTVNAAAKETVVIIKRPEELQTQPQTVATVPADTPAAPDGKPTPDTNASANVPTSEAGKKPEAQQTASLGTPLPAPFPAPDKAPGAVAPGGANVNQFSDCENCPDMAVLTPEEQHRIAQFEFERRPVAVSRNEISIAEWEVCAADGGCPRYAPPTPNGQQSGAVLNVSSQDAQGYVAWLSRKTGMNYRVLAAYSNSSAARNTGKPEQNGREAARCAEANGWGWLEEMQNGGCATPPATAAQSAPATQTAENGKGFRVSRVVTWAPD